MAAMPPERSRSLHNFSLPPRLNWGSQRLLRCSKLHQSSSNDDVSFSDRKRRNTASFRSPPPPQPPHDSQIDVIREKLMIDLRSEVDKFRANFLGNSEFNPPPPHPPPDSRPWNLRTRRSPATAEVAAPPTVATDACGGDGGGGERVKFSVALSRSEIEDDFVEMIGRRPPRKPKKRPRYIQRQLDTLFPGLWLSEITADMYKVNESQELPK